MKNRYIEYLNSLHNFRSSGANALAESQSTNEYFNSINVKLGIFDEIVRLINSETESVIILTGHAGDGKSTLAIDIYKHFKKISVGSALESPLNEFELITEGNLSIVKDMSELSAEDRLTRFEKSMSEPGNWLIVSNTGPLLSTLSDYKGAGNARSDILRVLDEPLDKIITDSNKLKDYEKDVYVINLTRLDNAAVGASLITRLVSHAGWEVCKSCDKADSCPIKTNRDQLYGSLETVEKRIRWVYQRTNAYEKRLTMRQMIAQLSLSITGGYDCEDVNGSDDKILFSDIFFGYTNGRLEDKLTRLQGIELMVKSQYGASIGLKYESPFCSEQNDLINGLQENIKYIAKRFQVKGFEREGIRWRSGLRRILYLFCPIEDRCYQDFHQLFLKSDNTIDFDFWAENRGFSYSRSQKKKLKNKCLSVLLEYYTGFNSGQFEKDGVMYLTLKREDKLLAQSAQLVLFRKNFDDFDIDYDAGERCPVIKYKDISMHMPLPVIDYMFSSYRGEIGGRLSPVYHAKLDRFRTQILHLDEGKDGEDDVSIIRSGIDGEVQLYDLELSNNKRSIEKT
ncbi:MAG: hypothetical protein V7739_08990 [Motiliproteus sp.]